MMAHTSDNHPARATWRPLTPTDVNDLLRVAERIHPSLPESADVFAERIKLFPSGCLALVDPATGSLVGYAISHLIKYRQPPDLDAMLGQITDEADQYYVHDVAILPEYQGCGYAREGIEKLFANAQGFDMMCLVSVYGTAGFWGKYGFEAVEGDAALKEKVKGYGDDAVYLERKNERSGG